MRKNYHVFKNGRIERKENTVSILMEDGEREYIPVNNIESLYLHGQIDFNTRLLTFMNSKGIEIHVFGWNGYYSGSYIPKKSNISGSTLVEQVKAQQDYEKRGRISSKIVEASIHNMKRNISYYKNRNCEDLEKHFSRLNDYENRLDNMRDVQNIMGIEASARKIYYDAFSSIINDFGLKRREYNPPSGEINSLISYGNSLLYSSTTSAIRHTALEPSISFLHEPGDRRYSLSLDISDIFKPVLVDRIIFRVLNRNQINKENFREDLDGCFLDDKGRRIFCQEFEENLEETIKHPDLNRHVSYQYLIRLECYKLKRYLLAEENYSPFKRWW